MINVILHGSKGKMGMTLAEYIEKQSEIRIVAGIDSKIDGSEGYCGFSHISQCNTAADVVIDFSHTGAVSNLLNYCTRNNLPAVICTTALSDEERTAVLEAAKTIPVFNSPNMSLGISAITKSMTVLVPIFERYFDIEIVERHHNKKADSPSGTALLLADTINAVCTEKKNYIYGRHGNSDMRSTAELGIHAVRGGTISGEHTIIFAGNDEIIEIKHTALSRSVFAEGAVLAARFLIKQKAGLYTMNNLIGG